MQILTLKLHLQVYANCKMNKLSLTKVFAVKSNNELFNYFIIYYSIIARWTWKNGELKSG
jgi:hypothetical protein